MVEQAQESLPPVSVRDQFVSRYSQVHLDKAFIVVAFSGEAFGAISPVNRIVKEVYVSTDIQEWLEVSIKRGADSKPLVVFGQSQLDGPSFVAAWQSISGKDLYHVLSLQAGHCLSGYTLDLSPERNGSPRWVITDGARFIADHLVPAELLSQLQAHPKVGRILEKYSH